MPVLTLGIIILAVMFLIFGGLQAVPGPTRAFPGGWFEEGEELPPTPPLSGTVGIPPETTRTIPIAGDFSVSFESGEKSAAALRKSSVENGIFGRVGREVSFDATPQDLQSARIKLNITDTNLYGYLVAVLNGREIFNNYSLIGRLEIPVNTSILNPSNNILRVESSGSGWRIWAPSVYKFDADVLLNYFSLKTKSFDFSVDGSIGSIKGARLVVVSRKSGDGNLIARINGVEVYRGSDRLAIADFSPSLLKGANIVEFLSDKGARYDVSSAEAVLFYQPVLSSQALSFNLTESQYSDFGNATLSFGVQRILGNVVSILIKITDGAGRTHNILPQGILREGRTFSITIEKGDVFTGLNRIEFTTTGDGSVLITNATISRLPSGTVVTTGAVSAPAQSPAAPPPSLPSYP